MTRACGRTALVDRYGKPIDTHPGGGLTRLQKMPPGELYAANAPELAADAGRPARQAAIDTVATHL